MIIKRENLQFASKYVWTVFGDDAPRLTGIPDSTLLNRNEGYEVLYFINRYMNEHDLTSIEDAHKIECMIRHGLPSSVRSHKNVTAWIEVNWNKVDA